MSCCRGKKRKSPTPLSERESCKDIEGRGADLVLYPVTTASGLKFKSPVSGEYELLSWVTASRCSGAMSKFLLRELPRIVTQLTSAKVSLSAYQKDGIPVSDLLKISNQLRKEDNAKKDTANPKGKEG